MTLQQVTVFQVIGGQLDRWQRAGAPVPVTTVPGAPSSVTAAAPTATSASLSWGPPANTGGSAITGYTVSRTGGTPVTLAATARSYTFGGLTAATSYTLSVAAVNSVGTGTASTRTVTTPSATVTGARFPGDPNPKATGGRLYWGEARHDGTDPAPEESGTGTTVGNRHIYWETNKQPNALSVPNGPMAQAALDAHSHNRLPLLSWHIPGSEWAGVANGARDAEIDAWIAWCEAQAKPIGWIPNHEPEDGDGTPTDFRAYMQHIRARITAYEKANGKLKRLIFMGCLMAYTFTGGNGGTAAWWPGDGVWDVLGIDIYVDLNSVPTPPSSTILNSAWSKVIAFAELHKVPLFVTEWGVRSDNPNGAQIMQDFYDYCTSGAHDIIGMSYFNTGVRWTLTDNNGMLSKFRALMKAPDSIHMSDLGY